MEITPKNIYQRQTTLAEVGEEGQKKLQAAKIVVVGCGGLGCVAAVYLAGSGIGTIHLIDFDKVSTSNLHRQVFYKTEDIGKLKAEVLASHIKAIAPFVEVSYSKEPLSKQNVFQAIENYDIVLDCTDSLPVKYLLNDTCVISNKTLVYGSLYKFDGYVASFNVLQENRQRSANLRDAFPEIPIDEIPNCSEAGTLNSIVGIIGLMQANEVLKLVLSLGSPLVNQILIYNSLENTQFKMKLQKNTSIKSIEKLFEKEKYQDVVCELQEDSLQISTEELKKKLSLQKESENLRIISVIENRYTELPFDEVERIPLSQFSHWLEEASRSEKIQKDKQYVLICNRGISSYTATKLMKEKFPDLSVLSLEGGILNY